MSVYRWCPRESHLGIAEFRVIRSPRGPEPAGLIPGEDGFVRALVSRVVAAKLPDGRLAEFDAAAFMEFKAEGGSSKLGDKLLSFHRRHTAGAGGDPLLIRFTAPDGKEVIGLLRPPDPREPVAYYAVATSNTRVPTTKELAGLGIDQRKVTTDLSRDDLRDLVKDLVYTAMSLSRVQGTP